MQPTTASESLLRFLNGLADHFAALTVQEWSLNLVLTAIVVAIAIGLSLGLNRLLGFGARSLPGAPTAEKKVHASRAVRVSARLLGLVVAGVAAYLVLGIWGLDIAAMLPPGFAGGLGRSLVRLTLLLVVVVVAIEAISFFIGRLMDKLARATRDKRRAAQLKTLSPILKTAAHGIIVVMAILLGLSELGVKIGPLLAGAGVVGIAVGFGAQTLVKDFLTGMFLIIEDIVSVGDIVQIGTSSGLVEAMTLRTIRLRDFDGTLHVFPYSEAQVIHNKTKTFSYYVFNLTVSYDSDMTRAVELMHHVGEELQRDPKFSDFILEPIEVVGVDELADSGVKLKARIKTKPTHQWKVGREFNRRIKFAFDEAGIEIPLTQVKLVLPEASALDPAVPAAGRA